MKRPALAAVDRDISARALFVFGAVLAPSLLVPAMVVARAGQLALLVGLAVAAGRRVRWLRTVIFFAAVVAFNTLTPSGRILLEVLGFPLTDGALMVGLGKATSLTGLLFLSKLTIRRDLQLPGGPGRLVTQTFAYLRFLLDADVGPLARRPVEYLDQLFERAEAHVPQQQLQPAAHTSAPSRPWAIVALAMLTAASWGAAMLT